MTLLALLLAVAAFVCFVVDVLRTKSLIAAGLALVTLAWIVAATVEGEAVRW
jgi:uncharacterized membrane protein YGL010W